MSAAEKKQLDELQEEALKYVVEVFTEDEKNTAQDLYAFLTKIGGERFSGKIVRELAEQYLRPGALRARHRGVRAPPQARADQPRRRSVGAAGRRRATTPSRIGVSSSSRSTARISQYTTGGPWSRTQGDPANVAATGAAIEKALRQDATSLHAKAQKDKTSRAEFEGAVALYDVYLSKFGSEPKAYELQFYVGEIDFFRLERNLDAATHYIAAAKGIPKEATPEIGGDAPRRALQRARRPLARDGRQARGKKGETEADKKYAEALDLYAQFYPNDPQLPGDVLPAGAVLLRQRQLRLGREDLGHARSRSSRTASSRATRATASSSRSTGRRTTRTSRRGRAASRRCPSSPARSSRRGSTTLIVQAVFKQGEQKAAAGDHAAAAAAYLRAAKEFPKDARAAQACVNAEQEAKLAGDAKTLQEAAQLAMGPAVPRQARVARRRLDCDDDPAGDGALRRGGRPRRADDEPGRPRAPQLRQVRAREGRGVQRGRAARGHRRARQGGARRQQVLGHVRVLGARPTRWSSRWGARTRTRGAPRTRPSSTSGYITRAKNLDHRAQGLVLLAQAQLKIGDERAAEVSLDEAVTLGKHRARELSPRGSTPPRTRATCRASACSPSSSRSRSPATSSSSRRD